MSALVWRFQETLFSRSQLDQPAESGDVIHDAATGSIGWIHVGDGVLRSRIAAFGKRPTIELYPGVSSQCAVLLDDTKEDASRVPHLRKK